MKKITWIILLTFDIVMFTALAATEVGKVPTNVGAYDWTLPIEVFLFIAAPAILGYLIGKSD